MTSRVLAPMMLDIIYLMYDILAHYFDRKVHRDGGLTYQYRISFLLGISQRMDKMDRNEEIREWEKRTKKDN